MKKIIALVVALVMMAAMAVPAFAADFVANNANVGGTQIIYGATQSYTVTIPSSISLEAGVYSTAADVTISNYKLAVGYEVALTIDSAYATDYYDSLEGNKWYLVEATTNDEGAITPLAKDNEARTADDVLYTVYNSTTGTHEANESVDRGAEIVAAVSNVNPQPVTTKLVFHTVGTSQVTTFTDIVSFTADVHEA